MILYPSQPPARSVAARTSGPEKREKRGGYRDSDDAAGHEPGQEQLEKHPCSNLDIVILASCSPCAGHTSSTGMKGPYRHKGWPTFPNLVLRRTVSIPRKTHPINRTTSGRPASAYSIPQSFLTLVKRVRTLCINSEAITLDMSSMDLRLVL